MEYEIGDDPQGLPDQLDGDRKGGLHEGRIIFHKRVQVEVVDRDCGARDENAMTAQFGDVA